MCIYSEKISFPGCQHVVPSQQLGPAHQVMLDFCGTHANALNANHQQAMTNTAEDDPFRMPLPEIQPFCSNFDYRPGTVSPAPIPSFSVISGGPPPSYPSAGAAVLRCPDCSGHFRRMDDNWKDCMDMIKRFSAHCVLGKGTEALRQMPGLRDFVPATAVNFETLKSLRDRATTRGPAMASSANKWDFLLTYQCALTHRFIARDLPIDWEVWTNIFFVEGMAEVAVGYCLEVEDLLQLQLDIQHELPADLPFTAVPDWYDAYLKFLNIPIDENPHNPLLDTRYGFKP